MLQVQFKKLGIKRKSKSVPYSESKAELRNLSSSTTLLGESGRVSQTSGSQISREKNYQTILVPAMHN